MSTAMPPYTNGATGDTMPVQQPDNDHASLKAAYAPKAHTEKATNF